MAVVRAKSQRQQGDSPHARTLFLALMLFTVTLTVWMLSGAPPAEHRHSLGYLLYLPVCALSAGLLLKAAKRLEHPGARGWLLLGAGVVCWGLGEATYGIIDAVWQLPVFPSPADLFYLSFFPLFMLGLFSFPREPLTRPQLVGFLLDVAIAVTVIANIIWHASELPATLAGNVDNPLAWVLSLAYPLSDLLLAAVLLVTALWRPRGLSRLQLLLLTAGTLMFLGADLAYGYLSYNFV